MIESWKKPLKVKDAEVGRVYFINMEAVFDDHKRWTKGTPFTVNPENGKTLESVIMTSQVIPNSFKRKLVEKSFAEMNINSGILRLYLSEDIAPDTWGQEQVEDNGGLILL